MPAAAPQQSGPWVGTFPGDILQSAVFQHPAGLQHPAGGFRQAASSQQAAGLQAAALQLAASPLPVAQAGLQTTEARDASAAAAPPVAEHLAAAAAPGPPTQQAGPLPGADIYTAALSRLVQLQAQASAGAAPSAADAADAAAAAGAAAAAAAASPNVAASPPTPGAGSATMYTSVLSRPAAGGNRNPLRTGSGLAGHPGSGGGLLRLSSDLTAHAGGSANRELLRIGSDLTGQAGSSAVGGGGGGGGLRELLRLSSDLTSRAGGAAVGTAVGGGSIGLGGMGGAGAGGSGRELLRLSSDLASHGSNPPSHHHHQGGFARGESGLGPRHSSGLARDSNVASFLTAVETGWVQPPGGWLFASCFLLPASCWCTPALDTPCSVFWVVIYLQWHDDLHVCMLHPRLRSLTYCHMRTISAADLGAWAATATLEQKRELIRNCSDKSDASTAALLETLLLDPSVLQ